MINKFLFITWVAILAFLVVVAWILMIGSIFILIKAAA
jgi:hypothetical protein